MVGSLFFCAMATEQQNPPPSPPNRPGPGTRPAIGPDGVCRCRPRGPVCLETRKRNNSIECKPRRQISRITSCTRVARRRPNPLVGWCAPSPSRPLARWPCGLQQLRTYMTLYVQSGTYIACSNSISPSPNGASVCLAIYLGTLPSTQYIVCTTYSVMLLWRSAAAQSRCSEKRGLELGHSLSTALVDIAPGLALTLWPPGPAPAERRRLLLLREAETLAWRP
ncbi:hypothetical protein B0J13DRAFT_221633 [Dactylonectria estremocensis]|uniref:Uncharacterized protein n=1 Tax=Dactylonectria estremocensis TaxID=1079267 RepID=A0A9P9JEJ9_9HYPO|nr:hypothetical protein B0J13DRAFT_221633 [Dactylonectria estremocensis]